MKRKGVKILLLLLAIFLAGYALMFAFDTQKSVRPERPDTVVASLPLTATTPLTLRVADGVDFKLDTGSDISCITPDDLELLRRRGAAVRTRTMPIFGRNSTGALSFALTRYVIDLPLEFFTAHTDSTGTHSEQMRMSERDNILRNVEFILVDEPGAMSCFGIDLLRHFAVEHLYNDRLVRFHTVRPDGYQDFARLIPSYWPTHTPWPGRRYYIDLDVDHVRDRYFLDTGLRKASLKLPEARAGQSRRRLGTDTLNSHLGHYVAQTDDAWVECGNRAGTQLAFYCDNDEEPYSFNPLNFFSQDLLIDYIHSSVALRPFVALPKRHFMGRDSLVRTTPGASDTARKDAAAVADTGRRTEADR